MAPFSGGGNFSFKYKKVITFTGGCTLSKRSMIHYNKFFKLIIAFHYFIYSNDFIVGSIV
ncbi:hypothetical protein D3C80_2001440 [compost metagenome]